MDREDEGPVAMGRGREVLICSNGSVIPFLELQDKFWEDEAVEGGLSGMIEGELKEEILEVDGGYIGYTAEDGEEVVVDGAGDPAVHGDVEGVSGELEGHDLALEEPDVAIGVEDASLKRSRKTTPCGIFEKFIWIGEFLEEVTLPEVIAREFKAKWNLDFKLQLLMVLEEIVGFRLPDYLDKAAALNVTSAIGVTLLADLCIETVVDGPNQSNPTSPGGSVVGPHQPIGAWNPGGFAGKGSIAVVYS
ncbi:hypothetical protein COCNU_scaffold001126G000020 [Cocos nucifera]|nr:hypothetical protein [Cocos nucifera]